MRNIEQNQAQAQAQYMPRWGKTKALCLKPGLIQGSENALLINEGIPQQSAKPGRGGGFTKFPVFKKIHEACKETANHGPINGTK